MKKKFKFIIISGILIIGFLTTAVFIIEEQ